MKLVVTSSAAIYVASPAWFAAKTTVPEPVSMIVLFEVILAGPLFTLNFTGRLLVEVGMATLNGFAP